MKAATLRTRPAYTPVAANVSRRILSTAKMAPTDVGGHTLLNRAKGKPSWLEFVLALAAVCLVGCKTAQVTSEHELAPPVTVKPTAVYVADFELWAEEIQQQPGILSGRIGPVGRLGDRLSGNSSDPTARARQLVNLMANSLVKELTKTGFNAVRLQPGAPVPTEGWLLQGVFTEVQEGNRLRRALIGFGQGQTDIQVVANVQDLSKGPAKPLYEVATDAASGDKPGAAPTLVLSPYGAAARFVLAGRDLDTNVKQTAAQIADRMAKRLEQPPSGTRN